MSWKFLGRSLVTVASTVGIIDIYDKIDKKNSGLTGEYDPKHDPRSIWDKIYSELRWQVYGTSVNEKVAIGIVFYALWKYQEKLLRARNRKQYSM